MAERVKGAPWDLFIRALIPFMRVSACMTYSPTKGPHLLILLYWGYVSTYKFGGVISIQYIANCKVHNLRVCLWIIGAWKIILVVISDNTLSFKRMYEIIILKGKGEQAKALIYRRQQIINVEGMLTLGNHHFAICCCCCEVASVVSDSVRPHRWQPTRLPCPSDFPGKDTGVGCHFLLQCMKVKSESEVAQSCLTLSDPMTAAY